MKHFLLIGLSACAIWLCAPRCDAAPDTLLSIERTITDVAGRNLDVTVLADQGASIRIRRKMDGKEFDIPLERLSQKDRQWWDRQREAHDKPVPTQVDSSTPEEKATAPEANPAIPTAPSYPPPPGVLLENIPPLDAQLKELVEIAERLEKTYNLVNEAKKFRELIAKAEVNGAHAWVTLSEHIRLHPHADKLDGSLNRSFDLLRLGLLNGSDKALGQIFGNYWWKNHIPKEYIDDCFALLTKHSEAGDVRAVIGLACTRIYSNRVRPEYDKDNLRKLFPTESYVDELVSIKMLEDALRKNPSREMKRQINSLRATAYAYSMQIDNAESVLLEMGDRADHYASELLARCYYHGKGCERNLDKALLWYEKWTKLTGSQTPVIESIRLEKKFNLGTIRVKLGGDHEELEVRLFGIKPTDRVMVIFGSNGFRAVEFVESLSEFTSAFDAGWNLVVFDYPDTVLRNALERLMFFQQEQSENTTYLGKSDFLSGIADSIITSLQNEKKFKRILLVGNSMGAGVLAWDLAKIQEKHECNVIFISPTESFLPMIAELKKFKNFTVVGKPDNDPFVRDSGLKGWILAHPPNTGEFDGLREGHLILGESLPYGALVESILNIK